MHTDHQAMTDAITVVVNGTSRNVSRDLTLLELLERFDVDPRAVVVEHNREIVRRPAFAETRLREGDSVELVHFVGGG